MALILENQIVEGSLLSIKNQKPCGDAGLFYSNISVAKFFLFSF